MIDGTAVSKVLNAGITRAMAWGQGYCPGRSRHKLDYRTLSTLIAWLCACAVKSTWAWRSPRNGASGGVWGRSVSDPGRYTEDVSNDRAMSKSGVME